MNCKSYQTEIEELFGAKALADETVRHLDKCLGCKTFKTERDKLRALVECLEKVNAPENFEFGVRAKLNSPNSKSNPAFGWRKLIYAAPALAILILGFVLASSFVNSSRQPNAEFAANQPQQTTAEIAVLKPAPSPEAAKQTETVAPEFANPIQPVSTSSLPAKNQQAVARNAPRKNTEKSSREEILVRDSGNSRTLGVSEQKVLLTPTGIPPEQPKTSAFTSAKNLLTFHGIETTEETDSLRVTSVKSKTPAESAGIKTGDLIQAINGRKPQNLNASSLDSLTVQRNLTTQEIKLSTKP